MELWKNVYESPYSRTYQVSTKGNVRRIGKTEYLKFSCREGYPSVCLSYENIKKTYHIHRLVATSFLPNPRELPVVNHKDGNRCNNCLANLEWVTHSGNVQHALNNGLSGSNKLKVQQLDLNGNLIKEFDSIIEAANETKSSNRHISSVCKGKRQSHNGFKWKYSEKVVNNIPKEYKILQNYPNYLVTPNGQIYNKSFGQFMKPHRHANGYLSVGLSNNGVKKEYYIHQLVASTFIPNPEEKQYVNHKNCKKDDNNKNNLEWVTTSENMLHANTALNFAHKKSVCQCDLQHNVIQSFSSVKEASSVTGVDNSSIVKTCKGKMKSAGGYYWKYN